VRGEDVETQAGLGEEVAATGGGGGEDEGHWGFGGGCWL
jgi:hypothetical protein